MGKETSDLVRLPDEVWTSLILLARKKRVFLEGSILTVLDAGESRAYQDYLHQAQTIDSEKKRTRTDAVKREIQATNAELVEAKTALELSQDELKGALEKAEQAREEAEQAREEAEDAREAAEEAREVAVKDLNYMQKRTQFELMGNIVNVALWVIAGVGITTTVMYAMALFGTPPATGDTTLLGNTWSNMFGILLTNSFSIIGTIMGVKYATENRTGEGSD